MHNFKMRDIFWTILSFYIVGAVFLAYVCCYES